MNTSPEPDDPGFSSERLALALHRATALVDRVADAYLRPAHDISVAVFATLITIDAIGPARQSTIAAGLGVSRAAVTQRLTELLDRGLVEVTGDPTHRRANLVTLSPSGTRLRAEAWAGLAGSQDGLEEGVDLVALQRGLDRLIANAEAHLDALGGR